VVQQAVEVSESAVQTAGLKLEVHLPRVPVYAEADAARLVQVISNIVNNAVKFTPSGGTIAVALRRDGDYAVLEIRDTGIGIEAGQIAHVFDMFMQADPSSERRGGLGLGLTLAKSLVEQHGGRITVRSEGLGRGAEFSIYLPALAEAPEGVAPLRAPARAVQRMSRRILVVDDNQDSAYFLALLLEHHGHEVRQAHDGLEAVEAAAAFQPDVVLLDIGLPVLDGYEAAQRIRQQLGSELVLVALTGWGHESDRRRSEAAGFNAHLVKPVDNDALIQLIAELPHRDTAPP
jgi:CheY-like chemotaxis protein/anti-sigma regulatory factor (Ser/Thr protein kinase)